MAEDSLINLHVIRKQIADHNLTEKTTFCTDGQQTIDAFREALQNSDSEQPVTLIISDLQMPQKNGLQVVKEVR